MKINHLTISQDGQLVGSVAIREQAVNAAKTRAARTGKPVSVIAHIEDGSEREVTTLKEGAAAVPYHADGELCRMYPAEEFAALAQAATAHVFWHRTYCNHVNAWIRRAGLEELGSITYGSELPEDLAAHMAGVLAAAGGGGDDV